MNILALDKRWVALGILCLGDLMIILDTTIVNVALPSIQTTLGFTQTSLVWVINAYMLTFSGFLLLGGRLGDIYGQRRMFLFGLTLFTLASLACGLAQSQVFLVVSRAIQGLGGAVVSAVALSLIMNLFTESNERARAMGFFGFVAAGGGALGVFLGGILTTSFDWHWNFLVNIPIGIIVFALCYTLLPHSRREDRPGHLDIFGALTVTASLILAVYAIVNGNSAGWMSIETLGLLAAAVVLFSIFVRIEKNVKGPLVPFSIFKLGNIAPASIVGVLWSASMFSWFFLSALYMQLILGYTPYQVGLAFLPSNLIMGTFSVGLSAKIVMRYGKKRPLAIGMASVALGLLLFAFSPVNGTFLLHVLPGMIFLGIGAGLAFNPVLLSATESIPENEAGLASGVLNTAFMMGGSLGLAILASLAAMRTESLHAFTDALTSLNGGYHVAFFVGSLCAAIAAVISLIFLHEREHSIKTSFH